MDSYRGKGVEKEKGPTENRLLRRYIDLTPIPNPVIARGKHEFGMEVCFEHEISFQPPVNRTSFGLSRILREELVGFCREQVHVERFPMLGNVEIRLSDSVVSQNKCNRPDSYAS